MLKAVSENYLCALVYDTEAAQLQTVSFATSDATVGGVISADFYAGIDINDADNTYAISEDCTGVRINDIIGHLNTDSS